MKTYRSCSDGKVTVNGAPLPLRLDLANKSPTGFSWGYSGSGPAQLSIAILADHAGDKQALRYYQPFKERFIASLDANSPWTLTTEDVESMLEEVRTDKC